MIQLSLTKGNVNWRECLENISYRSIRAVCLDTGPRWTGGYDGVVRAVVGTIMAPEMGTSWSLEPMDMWLYMAKETLLMWLRILTWWDYPGLSMCSQCDHEGPYKWKAEARSSELEKEIWLQKQKLEWWAFKAEERTTGQGMQAASRRWKRQGDVLL